MCTRGGAGWEERSPGCLEPDARVAGGMMDRCVSKKSKKDCKTLNEWCIIWKLPLSRTKAEMRQQHGFYTPLIWWAELCHKHRCPFHPMKSRAHETAHVINQCSCNAHIIYNFYERSWKCSWNCQPIMSAHENAHINYNFYERSRKCSWNCNQSWALTKMLMELLANHELSWKCSWNFQFSWALMNMLMKLWSHEHAHETSHGASAHEHFHELARLTYM